MIEQQHMGLARQGIQAVAGHGQPRQPEQATCRCAGDAPAQGRTLQQGNQHAGRAGQPGQHAPGVGAIGPRGGQAQGQRDACADGLRLQLGHRMNRGRRAGACAFLVALAAGKAADLAAGGLEHGMRTGQHDLIGRHPDHIHRHLVERRLQRGAGGRVLAARFGHDDQPFAARRGVGAGEHGHAAAADAGHFADRLFQVVRIDVAAAPLDQVLDPAGDEYFALHHAGIVAGVEPAGAQQPGCRLRIAEIAGRGGRPAKFQPPHMTLGQLAAGVIDDADLVARQGLATRYQCERVAIRRRCRHT